MRAGDAIKGMFTAVGEAGKSAAKAVPAAFKKGEAAEVVEQAAKSSGPIKGFFKETIKADMRGMAGIAKTSASGAWYVASRPIAWGAQATGWGASKVGGFYTNNPRLAIGATAAVAAVGVGHLMNKRAERSAMDNINQLEMAQAQQAAMAQAQANTYRVSPEESAMLEARMKQGGGAQGFAAAESAKRSAAQASQTPAV